MEEPRTARELAFEQVHELHATGLSTRAVTKHLGLWRITVSKYLRAEQARAPRTTEGCGRRCSSGGEAPVPKPTALAIDLNAPSTWRRWARTRAAVDGRVEAEVS